MAIESYFWIPLKKSFSETRNKNIRKIGRVTQLVVIYCAMKGRPLIRTLVSSFDHAYKAMLKHRVPVTFGSKKQD